MTSETKPRVNKPRAFIHYTRQNTYHKTVGLLNVGRLAIPAYLILWGYGIVTFVGLIVGGILNAINGDDSLGTMVAPLIMLGIAVLVAVLIGLVALGKWVWSEIEWATDERARGGRNAGADNE